MTMLAPQTAEPRNSRFTLFTGEPGGGLTHHLQTAADTTHHPRIVTLDCATQSHKYSLIDILAQCQATAPPRASVPDLASMASLAIASRPTLLLLDNLHLATPKFHRSAQTIIPYAAETIATFATPVTSAEKIRAFEWYLARGRRTDIEPLGKTAVIELAKTHIDDTLSEAERDAAARRVAQISHGHAKTAVAAATSIETGQLDELRQMESGRQSGEWSLLWLGIALVIVIVALNADRFGSAATAGAVVLVIMLILRRLLSRSLAHHLTEEIGVKGLKAQGKKRFATQVMTEPFFQAFSSFRLLIFYKNFFFPCIFFLFSFFTL